MKKAFEWFQKAALQGHPAAQNSLGACYWNGYGVGKSKKRGVEWFQRSALQNNPNALYNLACFCYENGEGVEKSKEKAAECYHKIASVTKDASNNLKNLIKYDPTLAISLYRSKVDLTKALEEETFGDFRVGDRLVHSALLSVRCPVLLSTPLNISSKVLSQLLSFVYGGSLHSSFDLEELIELYRLVSLPSLGCEMEVLMAISEIIKEKGGKEILEFLRKCDELHLDDLIELGLQRIGLLAPSISEELLIDLLDEVGVSKRIDREVIKAHATILANPSLVPNWEIALPKNVTSLSDHLKILLESGEGSDFTLIVEESEIPVHCFVLSTRNAYFRALLQPHTLESQQKKSSLPPPLTASSAKKVLEFLYCGIAPPITPRESFEILMSKDFLCLDDSSLVQSCKDCIESPVHCLETFALAFQLNQEEAMESVVRVAVEYFEYLNFSSLSEEWTTEIYQKWLTLMQSLATVGRRKETFDEEDEE